MKLQSQFSALLVLLATTFVWGQVPQTIGYQGFLSDANGKAVPNGNYALTVKLYRVADGGAPLWTETQTVAIRNGAFNAILGSTKRLNIPLDKSYWIGHAVETGPELTPRIKFVAAAKSDNAGQDELVLVTGNAGTGKTSLSQKTAANNGFALNGCLIINCSRQPVGGPTMLHALRQN